MSASQPHPAREELFAYRDGELKHDRRVVIEAHVLGCHICRELIDDVSRMEADLSVGAPVPKDAYFERLSDQVMVKVAAADTTPSVDRRRLEAEAEWEEKRTVKPSPVYLRLDRGAAAAVISSACSWSGRARYGGARPRRGLGRSADADRARRATRRPARDFGSHTEEEARGQARFSPASLHPRSRRSPSEGSVEDRCLQGRGGESETKADRYGHGRGIQQATTRGSGSNENKSWRARANESRYARRIPPPAQLRPGDRPVTLRRRWRRVEIAARPPRPTVRLGPAVSDDQVLRAERAEISIGSAAPRAADSARVAHLAGGAGARRRGMTQPRLMRSCTLSPRDPARRE